MLAVPRVRTLGRTQSGCRKQVFLFLLCGCHTSVLERQGREWHLQSGHLSAFGVRIRLYLKELLLLLIFAWFLLGWGQENLCRFPWCLSPFLLLLASIEDGGDLLDSRFWRLEVKGHGAGSL